MNPNMTDFNWLRDALILTAKHSQATVAGHQVYGMQVTHYPGCDSLKGNKCDCIPDIEYTVKYKGGPLNATDHK